MKRRTVLSGVAASLAWPGDLLAQTSRKPVIGCLFQYSVEPNLTQFRAALARLGYRVKIDAAIVQPTLTRTKTISLALRHRIPTGQPWSGYATMGGLLSYSARPEEISAEGASIVDQILKGVTIADIPMRQPTRFEMGLNLKTANALGLTIPPMLLAQADEIIE